MTVVNKRAIVVVAETYRYALPFFEGAQNRDKFLSYGDAFPDTSDYESTAWWMAGGYAARLYVSGICPKLSAPGAHWLSMVPENLLGRKVITGTIDEFPEEKVWAKPAEVKIPEMLPGWWGRKQIESMGNPEGTLYQWTHTFLQNLNHEHRIIMVKGEPVTWSPYLIDGIVYSTGMESPHTSSAVDFSRVVAKEMKEDFPPVCSLDVGLTDSGWVVIEANPAWSSGLYGCDPYTVVDALDSASSEVNPRWLWNPSEFAIEQAKRNQGFIASAEEDSGLMKMP